MTLIEETRPLSQGQLRELFDRTLDGEPAGGGAVPPAARGTAARGAAAEIVPVAPPAFDMAALLRLTGRDFLDHVYPAVLHRPADDFGISHYLQAMAAGRSRISVMGELRYSTEGKIVGVACPGLRRRYLLHRLYRFPILGRLLRTLTGIVALPGMMRDMGGLSAELGALRTQVAGLEDALQAAQTQNAAARMAMENQIGHGVRVTQDALAASAAQIEAVHRQALTEPWAPVLLMLAEQLEEQLARLRVVEGKAAAAERAGGAADAIAAAVAMLDAASDRQEKDLSLAEHIRDVLNEPRFLAQRAVGATEDLRAALRDQERRLSLILAETRRLSAPGGDASGSEVLASEQEHLLDSLYVEFEDRFRGARSDIKQRQRVYLDVLRDAGAGTEDRPIVDVGSGRGELLEMLGEEGLRARGVDLNEAMVRLCADAGLDCVFADAVAYLSGLRAGSLGAVTGFHIIEHLPFPAMVALLDASLHALAPGGIVIFETPNPANLMVASRWFYLDPTHRNPLPGEMVAMIAEARGFVDVGIRELHPMQQRFVAHDEELAAQLDAIFHGPQDYALIARKA